MLLISRAAAIQQLLWFAVRPTIQLNPLMLKFILKL